MNNNEYIRIRKAWLKLNSKIWKTQTAEMMETSAKLLGMMGDDNLLVMEDESDADIIMDFSYNEAIHNGKSGIELFLDTKPRLSSLEEELCKASRRAYTSFFKVKSTIPNDSVIIFWDLLNGKEIQLMDVNMSKTISLDVILFCRVVEWQGMGMTSGIGFPFTILSEQALLRQYRRDLRKVVYPDESVARYIAAYRMKTVFSDPSKQADV